MALGKLPNSDFLESSQCNDRNHHFSECAMKHNNSLAFSKENRSIIIMLYGGFFAEKENIAKSS
jgi:hypothetical protein